jgi:hypothetical protein
VERGDIGDLSMSRVQRIVLIWEGVCAKPPQSKQDVSFKDRLKRLQGRESTNWHHVVRQWEIFELPLARIHAMTTRGTAVDVVTFLGEEYCNALRERLELMHVEPTRVDWYEDVASFARDLRTSPAVQYVVDSDPERLKRYGGRAMAATLGDDWGKYI